MNALFPVPDYRKHIYSLVALQIHIFATMFGQVLHIKYNASVKNSRIHKMKCMCHGKNLFSSKQHWDAPLRSIQQVLRMSKSDYTQQESLHHGAPCPKPTSSLPWLLSS